METERYRKGLLREETEIIDRLRQRKETQIEQSNPGVLDPVDEAVFSQSTESLFAQADRDTQLLRDVRNALRRIDEGTYGYCLVDGDPIREVRLRAIPWAAYCVTHQASLDES